MANAGRILLIPKGEYDANATYEMLDMVSYNNATWVAKTTITGATPSDANSDYWFKMAGQDISNTLTTISAGYVLDARQGKVLKDLIDSANTNVDGLTDRVTSAENTAGNAYSVAVGRNQAHVFATTEAMQTALANVDNAGKYNVGDNLYIEDVGVPDWWVAEVLTEADASTGYYYRIAQLETQKVDLTETNESIARLNEAVPDNVQFRITDDGALQYRVLEV